MLKHRPATLTTRLLAAAGLWIAANTALAGPDLVGEIPIVGVRVDKSKYTRAEGATPIFEAGKVFLPEDAPWVDEWIEEHIAFAGIDGEQNDWVDTSSGALARLAGATVLTWGTLNSTRGRGKAKG